MKVFLAAVAAGDGLQLSRTIVRRNRSFDWQGKRVVITGGSRGLGLVIGRQLARQGARLAITARTENDLKVAARYLQGNSEQLEVTRSCHFVRDVRLGCTSDGPCETYPTATCRWKTANSSTKDRKFAS